MPKTFSLLLAAELVHHIGECVENLYGTLKTASEYDAALFFPVMMYEDEVYAQPLVIPVEIANQLMTIILGSEPLGEDEFVKYVSATFNMMRMNDRSSAPINTHVRLLEMFERIARDGMIEHSDEVQKLASLKAGDLVVMQFEIEERHLYSGLRIISDPLDSLDLGVNVAPHSATVH